MANYADIIRKGINTEKSTTSDASRDDGIVKKSDKSVTKRARRNYNYDSWERAFFQDLLNMRDIFAKKYLEMFPEEFYKVYSPQFLHKFCRMIYSNSTGEISSYVDDFPENLESTYFEYLIKRKNS